VTKTNSSSNRRKWFDFRRPLEALFDIGRHILAKKFAYSATEYKEIAKGLFEKKVLETKEAELMR